jgi:MraZ protein
VGKYELYSLVSGKKWVAQYPYKIKTTKRVIMDYFERRLDDKRRLSIPTELRSEFQSGYVLTQGFNQYLHLYSKEVWDQKVEPALKGDILSEATADLNVRFRMGKTEGQIDNKQGRLSIEQHLLDYAQIKKDIVAVRAGLYWRLMPKTS